MALSHMLHLVVTTNPYIPNVTSLGGTLPSSTSPNDSSTPDYTGGPPSTRRLAGTGPLARANATKGGTVKGDVIGRESPVKPFLGSQIINVGLGLGATQNMVCNPIIWYFEALFFVMCFDFFFFFFL